VRTTPSDSQVGRLLILRAFFKKKQKQKKKKKKDKMKSTHHRTPRTSRPTTPKPEYYAATIPALLVFIFPIRSVAEPLVHCVPQDIAQVLDLGVVARMLHAVAPLQVPVDKHPLASVLAEVAALPDARAGREHVAHALERAVQDAGFDVVGFLVAHGEGAGHAQFDV
jgi:hypothetical protein